MTNRKIKYWVIPPKADAEYVACMENVLDTYAKPYDPKHPVLCMDEQPVQLLKEKITPIPASKNSPKKVDYEYERAGTACVFMFAEPKSGWRQVEVREKRTKKDWAVEVANLLNTKYKEAEEVTLVCDNLNTHTMGAFYEVFEANEARNLIKKIKFCYTPKHGSWLNIAENELSAMTRQCMHRRRFATIQDLKEETEAWANSKNEANKEVDWQMKIDDARCKLSGLYPLIK